MTLLPCRFVVPSVLRLAGALALAALSACSTEHRSYYSDASSILPAQLGEASVAVIEFDERGDFWDPGQVARADKMIAKATRPILVTYVHGWRHDARPSDGDLRSFRNFLNQLNQGSKRPVVGVFIGWRGSSVQEEGAAGLVAQPYALFSFWGRKKITDQMAGVPFNNTVWKLAKTAGDKGGNSILIGHSFGGRIVEHTLGPAAIAQMNNRKPMPYNLTFLINPATESLYARQLKLALRGWPKSSQPAIVALAAKDDVATGQAWPLALLAPSGIRSRDYLVKGVGEESQKTYIRSTVGNDQRQWTHQVIEGRKLPLVPQGHVAASNAHATSGEFTIRLRDDKPGEATLCTVQPLTSVEASHQLDSNAYWVIPVDKNILTGHGGIPSENGIFCQSMGDLMAGIIGKVGALRQEGATAPASNPGETEKSTAPKSTISLPRLSTPLF